MGDMTSNVTSKSSEISPGSVKHEPERELIDSSVEDMDTGTISSDFCRVCGGTDGKQMVCCDCTASYHLLCHDPPLDTLDLSPQWSCYMCTRPSDKEVSPGSKTYYARRLLSVEKKRKQMVKTNRERRSDGTPEKSSLRTMSTHSDPGPRFGGERSPEALGMETLLNGACRLGPTVFQLPEKLLPNVRIPRSRPGRTDSTSPTRMRLRRQDIDLRRKRVIDLENGQVPRPIRRCFVCARTCAVGPLLQCSFCSSCFHASGHCLDDPVDPLPLPGEAWMCPNHETSPPTSPRRLSERMALCRCKGSADDPRITEFLRSGMNWQPTERRLKVVVPDEVKAMYDASYTRLVRPADIMPKISGPDEPWPEVPPSSAKQNDEADRKMFMEAIQMLSQVSGIEPSQTTSRGENLAPDEEAVPSTKNSVGDGPNAVGTEVRPVNGCLIGTEGNTALNGEGSEEVKEEKDDEKEATWKEMEAFICSKEGEVDLSQMDDRFIRILAEDQIKELFNKPPQPSLDVRSRELPPSTGRRGGGVASRPSSTLARAMLTPLWMEAPVAKMVHRQLTIGLAPKCDLCLHDYEGAVCRFLSGHHATVFWDERAGQFELINYSQYGSIVDGLLYGGNARRPGQGKKKNQDRRSGGKRRITEQPSLAEEKVPGKRRFLEAGLKEEDRVEKICQCFNSLAEQDYGVGREGSAILYHNSTLQLGCLKFRFEVTEQE